MSDTPTASPVVLGRWENPGNLASIAALAAAGQVTILPHELIRTTDGRVYHWTTSALEIVSAPVHHGTVADVAALDGLYLLPSCTRGVHPGDTAFVTAAGCEYRVTSGINAAAVWAACTTLPTIPTTPAEVGADPAGTAATAVSTHNTAPDSHIDIRTLIADRALIEHQHARTDLPWITDPGASLLTAASASAQRTALGMTAWAVAPWTDGTTSDIPEGTQLYFTNARADARIAAQKGQAEGLAPLDAGGKVPTANLPDSIVGQVKFKGVWDASSNDPALPDASESKGFYYITSAAGTYGGIDYDVGDWCISDGTAWGKVDNTDAVVSFNGRIGAILPIASDYSAFYLGLHAAADDSARFGGQLPSYYETAIGNPSANGYILSSTTAGVRSWVAPYSHPATHAQSVIDSSTGWITDALAGKQPAGNYAGSATPGGPAISAESCSGNSATANFAKHPQFSEDAMYPAGMDITQRISSGIYQGSAEYTSTTKGWPMNGAWTHLIAATHTDKGDNYSMQIAGAFFAQRFFVRNTNGNGATPWVELLHNGNVGSATPDGALSIAKTIGLQNALDDKVSVSATGLGIVGNGSVGTLSTPADWAAIPVGCSRIYNGTTATGFPGDWSWYITKIANRDMNGGYCVMAVDFLYAATYMGCAGTSAAYPTWKQLSN